MRSPCPRHRRLRESQVGGRPRDSYPESQPMGARPACHTRRAYHPRLGESDCLRTTCDMGPATAAFAEVFPRSAPGESPRRVHPGIGTPATPAPSLSSTQGIYIYESIRLDVSLSFFCRGHRIARRAKRVKSQPWDRYARHTPAIIIYESDCVGIACNIGSCVCFWSRCVASA